MTDVLNIDWTRVGKKWVAYFDLLGFGDFVNNHPPERFWKKWPGV